MGPLLSRAARALVAVVRFIVRMWCDDTGAPNVFLVAILPWLWWTARFLRRAFEVAIAGGEVRVEIVGAVLLITLALFLAGSALQLGAGVFVPLAEALGGAFQKVGEAVSGVWGGVNRYRGGPDRSVGVLEEGGELHRPEEEREWL